MDEQKRDREKTMEVECAGSGDDGRFDLVRNCRVSYEKMDATPCGHAIDIFTETYQSSTGPYQMKGWYLPWAVQAFNQGGYDCTVVCLDCAVAARARFEPAKT
jgi:hypothetical protein